MEKPEYNSSNLTKRRMALNLEIVKETILPLVYLQGGLDRKY